MNSQSSTAAKSRRFQTSQWVRITISAKNEQRLKFKLTSKQLSENIFLSHILLEKNLKKLSSDFSISISKEPLPVTTQPQTDF